MSPAQAAQAANISRWTIMRAIKSQNLQAFRDNKNQWRIKSDDLTKWILSQPTHCAHPVQEVENPSPAHTNAHHSQETLELVQIRAELEAERMLRKAIETDRDHWRDIAQKLTETRSRKWWFW